MLCYREKVQNSVGVGRDTRLAAGDWERGRGPSVTIDYFPVCSLLLTKEKDLLPCYLWETCPAVAVLSTGGPLASLIRWSLFRCPLLLPGGISTVEGALPSLEPDSAPG